MSDSITLHDKVWIINDCSKFGNVIKVNSKDNENTYTVLLNNNKEQVFTQAFITNNPQIIIDSLCNTIDDLRDSYWRKNQEIIKFRKNNAMI